MKYVAKNVIRIDYVSDYVQFADDTNGSYVKKYKKLNKRERKLVAEFESQHDLDSKKWKDEQKFQYKGFETNHLSPFEIGRNDAQNNNKMHYTKMKMLYALGKSKYQDSKDTFDMFEDYFNGYDSYKKAGK